MACRQLGYLGGHLHMTHGNSSIGDLRAALAAGDAAAAAMEFDCAGEEGTLGACQWRNRPGNDCDPRAGAVGLVCQKPTYAVCPGVSEPHGDSCYDVYAHPDDRADFEAAQKVCQENGGGHLVQVGPGRVEYPHFIGGRSEILSCNFCCRSVLCSGTGGAVDKAAGYEP